MLHLFRKNRWESLNHGARAGGRVPSLLLLHYTGMRSAEEALERLCSSESEVSAHYLIEESGVVHSLVPEDRRAWHAGKSYWAGDTDINSASIGIEIVNPGHEFGYRAFPEHQIVSLIRLSEGIVKRYNIKPSRVLGHSDVAPGRKTDPGELFPWERLAREGVGLWPAPHEVDRREAEAVLVDDARWKELLARYGYNPDIDLPVLLMEFHRHFYPQNLGKPADCESAARLLSLLRQVY
ncbi:MAG: N-acetylmuramoyl-L-alanine amidase [Alphaproteobacteria bacterium]|nr:N-acetylmuramoyl-L-alanine amidase [Alphaproteobacteria bacterium]